MSENTPYSVLEEIEKHRKPISVAEVSRILGISRPTVYEMIQNGALPAMNLPGCRKVQFDPATLAAYYRRYNNPHTRRAPMRRAS